MTETTSGSGADDLVADATQERAHEAVRMMARVHGLDLSCYSKAFLGRCIEERAHTAGSGTAETYLERLAVDAAEADSFCRSLRVGYTEFFRNPMTFAVLEQVVLPQLIEHKGTTDAATLRVWSCGCAAGQEAWSVAMLLDELALRKNVPSRYRVIATDICEEDLAVARAGVYSAAAVGNLRVSHLNTYLVGHGDDYAVCERLRNGVTFAAYDLRDSDTCSPPVSVFGDFDLVLCCNLLLYYAPPTQRRMLEKVRRSLRPGGYLVTDEAERHIVRRAGGFSDASPQTPIFRSTRSRA